MITKSILSNFFCVVYIYIYILGQAIGSLPLIALSVVFGFLAFIVNASLKQSNMFFFIMMLSLLFLIALLNKTYPQARLFFNLIFLAVNFLLMHSFINNRINAILILKFVILGLILFILVAQVIAFFHNIHVYVYLDQLLKGFSYNYISGLLILSLTLYYAYYSQISMAPPFGNILAVICVILCYILYGRSGILFSICLFVIHYRNFFNAKYGIRFLLTFLLLSIVVVFAIYYSFIFFDAIQHSKFREGLQSPRLLMLKEYYNALNAYTFVFGVNMQAIPLITSFNVNPHNSYLNLHAATGLIGIIFILFVLVMLYKKMYFKPVTFLFLCVYLGRGLLDTIIFPGVLDFIFMGLLICGSSWVSTNNYIRVK